MILGRFQGLDDLQKMKCRISTISGESHAVKSNYRFKKKTPIERQ